MTDPDRPEVRLSFPDAQFEALGMLTSPQREQVYTVVTARQLDAATEDMARRMHDRDCEDATDPSHTGNERTTCIERFVPTAHQWLEHALYAAAQLPYDEVKDAIVVGAGHVIDAPTLLGRIRARAAFWVGDKGQLVHWVNGCTWWVPAVDRLGSLAKAADEHLAECPHR